MTDHETKIIDESIASYRRMIKYFEKQICILSNKKVEDCCFEEKKIKFKVKHGRTHDKKTKRLTGERPAKNRQT